MTDSPGLYVMNMPHGEVFGPRRDDVLEFAELISSNGTLRFFEGPRAER
ncbi:MAG TPA: hypothetical protein VFH77_09310 [Streptomyces sp.]|jgi:hypothetical protein|nr:hypothetical protein [Streptomyces sp.]